MRNDMNVTTNTTPTAKELKERVIRISFLNHEIRVLDNKWFALTDICKIISKENPSHVAKRIDCDHITMFHMPYRIYFVDTVGLMALITASKSEETSAFRDWVFEQVLPSVAHHGGYVVGQDHLPEEQKEYFLLKIEELSKKIMFLAKSNHSLEASTKMLSEKNKMLTEKNSKLSEENKKLSEAVDKSAKAVSAGIMVHEVMGKLKDSKECLAMERAKNRELQKQNKRLESALKTGMKELKRLSTECANTKERGEELESRILKILESFDKTH